MVRRYQQPCGTPCRSQFHEDKFITYVICGFLAGVAGLVASSRIYSADANNVGLNLEMDAILAVALGGNLLGGGKFTLVGSIIGAYTIQALTTTLYAWNVSSDQLCLFTRPWSS